MKTLKGNKASNHCTVSSKVQASFLFAHVYVGFLKTALCFGIVWRIFGGLMYSQLDKHFRVLRWLLTAWEIVTDNVAVYTWISFYHLKIFIQGQKMTLNYSQSVAAPGFTVRVVNGFAHDKHLIIIITIIICSRVQSGCHCHWRDEWCVFWNTLPAADVLVVFIFTTSCLSFQNNQVKKYAGYF